MGQSKKERAYEAIKAMILSRELSGAGELSESSLARELKMSRTPVREALQRLQMEGFLRVYPNRGIVVERISVDDIREIYDLRIALEEFVVREVASQVAPEDLKRLRSMVEEQSGFLDPLDAGGFVRSDREFHEYLLTLYGNEMITSFMRNLRERIYLANLSILQVPDNMSRFHQEHRRILQALEKGDGEAAAREMDVHLKGGKMRLMNL
ncbi:MAG: GntR family transcriptional regulator [Synergistales bacterium]|nr:GntR family transcriptional regulator [Synergistales bacterium]